MSTVTLAESVHKPEASIIPDVMLPWVVHPDPDGEVWALFYFDAYPGDPWEWPKVLRIDGALFVFRSHDSDAGNVCYSEQRQSDVVAAIVEGGQS